MRNHDFDVFLENIYFWRENGRGRHTDAKGSGPSRADQKGKPLSNKNVLVTQETIIYRLVVINRDFDAFLENILFLAGKWAWRQRGWGLKTQPKS